VSAAQKSLAVAQQQYAQLVSGGVATPQNVGNFNTQSPVQVADAYNAAIAYALGSFATAAQQAQDATNYIASVNPNARVIQAQSQAVAQALSSVASIANACASRSVIDPATGQCCDPNSCSWNTQSWTVKPSFTAQTDTVAMYTVQVVALATQALAVPMPPPPSTPTIPVPRFHSPVRLTTPMPTYRGDVQGFGRIPFNFSGPRIGLGQVPGIIQNLGDPQAIQAFQNLYTQMQQEYSVTGQAKLLPDIGVVASDFVNSYQNVAAQTSDLSIDVVGAASSFVGAKGSISAAVTVAEGLAQGIATGSIPDIVNAFQGVAGAAVSASIAAGAVSAGVGAAIVVGLALAAGALDSLFGSPPRPAGYIGSCPFYNNKPNIIIPQFDWSGNQSAAYVWSWGNRTTPGPGSSSSVSPGWRRFPDPSNSADAPWFQPISYGGAGSFSWSPQFSWAGNPIGHPDTWYSCQTSPNDDGVRAIDHACYTNGSSIYNHLASEMLFSKLNPVGGFSQFQQAFFTAWQANREYGLNGMSMLPDYSVLQHAVEMWNKSHSTSQTYRLAPSSAGILDWKSPPVPVDPYEAIILANAYSQLRSSPHFPLQQDGSVTLNVGPSYSSSVVLIPTGGVSHGAPSGTSTGSKVLIGLAIAAGLAAAGEGYYAWQKKISYAEALRRTWDATGRRAWKATGAPAIRYIRRHV
jgi:hypothetical protein